MLLIAGIATSLARKTMSHETEQLERQTEIARAKLASSIDALRDKLTPEEIVQETIDYARETRAGQFARKLGRDVHQKTLPVITVFAGIAGVCMAVALRSQRKFAARDRAKAMVPQTPSALESDLFVAHEGWGVERVR